MLKVIFFTNIALLIVGVGMYFLGSYANIDWAQKNIIEPSVSQGKEISKTELVDAIMRLILRCEEARGSLRLMLGLLFVTITANFCVILFLYKKSCANKSVS